MELTWERIKELLVVDPEDGTCSWKTDHGTAKAGDMAGGYNGKGYLKIKIDGKKYYTHRLIWFFVHHRWPENDLDHINRKTDDNRISNLRVVSRSKNKLNHDGYAKAKNNTSGHTGVSWNKGTGKWHSYVNRYGKRKYIGLFDDKQDAIRAREDFISKDSP